MRITKDQAAENRARVVGAAAGLFREKGFDAVGVAELMHAAGLTHGGFYNHFASKEELEAAACEQVFEKSVGNIQAIAGIEDRKARSQALTDYRRRYVSAKARDASAPTCPMTAFAGDVSRQSGPAREAYAAGLRAYLDAYVRAGEDGRTQALAEFSTLVGALTLARSVGKTDAALSDEILAAARASIDKPKPRSRRRQSSAIAATSRP
jgi:TetR/AcrR family transcriptional regulator, transcriptional repressor for nem operon